MARIRERTIARACGRETRRLKHGAAGAVRRYPVGAEPDGETCAFRVWAPKRARVRLALENGLRAEMAREPTGHFSLTAPARAGERYGFLLDDDAKIYPDPASRFQPEGPHGLSQIINPRAYEWRDGAWRGVRLRGAVIYEFHVGTFTPEGTWRAAIDKLPLLRETGITLLEMMPVADFPGAFGWGYDGVNLYAPTRLYGAPDDLRAFVDAAHALGMGVIHDVVYNHVGPDGNYLSQFSDDWFTARHANEWGDAIDFDSPHAQGVREFFIANAAYWIDEFHFDGLRLDATQSIFDSSPEHVIAAMTNAARKAAGARAIVIIGENEPMDTRLLQPTEAGGAGLDAIWNDDLHHSAVVALTGLRQAYFMDHAGRPQEFISAAKYGALFQGQYYVQQRKPRGAPALDVPPEAFVNFLENHDQAANLPMGLRLHERAAPARMRALTTLFRLLPGTPMLFQGEEFNASAPFHYFADHEPTLAANVREGRLDFLSQFDNARSEAVRARTPAPDARETFEACRLDWSERARNAQALRFTQDILRLRRTDEVFAAQRLRDLDGAVIGPEAFVLRYFGAGGEDRLLIVNLGQDVAPGPLAEPLVAPPAGRAWTEIFCSEDPAYGGAGAPPLEPERGWRLPACCALALAAAPIF
jgi:maltooligosyltrehalose trehalohydrolase